jgi:hypothetical protein
LKTTALEKVAGLTGNTWWTASGTILEYKAPMA